MKILRRWTPEDDAELLAFVESELRIGTWLKDALELHSIVCGRTLSAVRNRYFKISKTNEEVEPYSPPFKGEPFEEQTIHHSLLSASEYIMGLELQNEALRKTIDDLWEQNKMLSERIEKLETCEAELNHLLTIINRSRKEAFAGEPAPKKYKVVDNVPVFE
jgi:predicted RNase H-like nuclease (RuvC/YqgF family)